MNNEVEDKKKEIEEKSKAKVEALKKMTDEQLYVIEDLKKRHNAMENTNAEQLRRLRRADADHASAKDDVAKLRNGTQELQTTIEKQALEREEIICREEKRVSELTGENERLQEIGK